MEKFNEELKKRCETDFISIKANNLPKKGKKGSIENAQNSLQAFANLSEKTKDMIVKNANEIYPEMGISKEIALKAAQDLTEDFLVKIKKQVGF